MIILLVDGDYLLSGFKPSSGDEVRGAVERLEDALTKQLLSARAAPNPPPAHASRIDYRVALFSSALMNSLTEGERSTIISSLRRLRFQTSVLESVHGRPGSPIDAALCTKAIMFAMMPGEGAASMGGGGGDSGSPVSGRHVFCFVSPNAYVGSALDLLTTRGCDVIFTIYDSDEVAEELLGYVSAAYGPGIATMPKRPGVAFIPNTEAASAALAALQQEGKDLPLSVLQELKNMQNSLTTRGRARVGAGAGAGAGLAPAGTAEGQAFAMQESRQRVRAEQAMFAPPPPLAGVPSPFADEPPAPAAADDDGEDAAATPYVYHDEDEEKAGGKEPLAPGAGPTPAAPATAPARPQAPTEWVCVTTCTSPPSIVAAARPPAGAPPPLQTHAPLTANPPATGAGAPAVATTLPAGWALLFDPAHRRLYFARHAPGAAGGVESTWDHPLGAAEARALEQDVEAWYQHEQSRQLSSPPPQPQPQPQPQQASTAALPPGWEERIDPRSGRTYYMNHQTKATTWTAPSATAPAVAATTTTAAVAGPSHPSDPTQSSALPTGWEERADPHSGRTYYVNHQTKQTTWTRPTRAEAEQAPAPVPPASTPPAGEEWEERQDGSGRTYYVNHQTKQTTWTRPVPPAAPAAPSPATALWEAKVDPRTGRTFYVNHQTKQTAWQIPAS